jgi:hypothetical protein
MDPNAEVPKCAEQIVWHDLLDFAIRQSLVGIFFYGMERLVGHPNKPIDEDVLEWYSLVMNIKEDNAFYYKKCSFIAKTFRKEGFRNCILKGQGNALRYPDPYIRMIGDIDIWLEGSDRKVIGYVRGLQPDARVVYHHVDFDQVKGVKVEVHYRPAFLNNMIANARLQRFFITEADKQFDNMVELPDGLGSMPVPTNSFDRIFQMAHISNHFFHEGIGLRQLMDYYYVLKQGFTESERACDERMFKRLGLYGFARAVMYVEHVVFGLQDTGMIVPMDERRGKILLKEIMLSGNFGHYDGRFGHDTNTCKLMKNIQRLYRDLFFVAYFPGECLWEPVFRLWHFGWRVYMGRMIR